MTFQDIKEILKNTILEINEDEIVLKDVIKDINEKECVLLITRGENLLYSHKLTDEWVKCKMEIYDEVNKLELSGEDTLRALSNIDLESMHWDWLKKNIQYSDNNYEWFYMFIDNKPVGACIIYHPESSYFEDSKIFYIEYIAIAPWNNDFELGNVSYKKIYRGLGPKLIQYVASYAIDVLELDYGFSLSSLPQSYTFYERLGMKNEPSKDKDRLKYFEMSKEETKVFLGRE